MRDMREWSHPPPLVMAGVIPGYPHRVSSPAVVGSPSGTDMVKAVDQ